MQRKFAILCAGPNLFEHWQRRHRAAREVGRVLNLDEPRRGAKGSARVDGWLDMLPGQNAPLGDDGPDQAAGEDRRGGHLPVQDVRPRFGNHLLAGLGVQANANLVAHGSGGHKERRLAAECGSSTALQQVDCGVLAVNVVAHLGRGHRRAHLHRGPRHRIGTQIDDCCHCLLPPFAGFYIALLNN